MQRVPPSHLVTTSFLAPPPCQVDTKPDQVPILRALHCAGQTGTCDQTNDR